MAKQDAYVSPIGAGPEPAASGSSKSKHGKAASGSAYLITEAYYENAMQDAKDRVAVAGARLAKLLNENLK